MADLGNTTFLENTLLMSVLPFLVIYRQIRDFRPRRGDSHLALAIDRQSPKIGDFEPQDWRNWRFLI